MIIVWWTSRPICNRPKRDGLQVAKDARNFLPLAFSPPFSAQARGQPISQKAEANMVDDPVGTTVMDRPHFQVALEFAESLFHIQESLVMA